MRDVGVPIPSTLRTALFVFWLCAAAVPGAGAEPLLACESDAEFVREALRLVPMRVDASRRGRLAKRTPARFGGFDRRRLGYQSVEIYFDEIGPFDRFLGVYGPVDVLVRLQPGGRWFALEQREPAHRDYLIGARRLKEADVIRRLSADPEVPIFGISLTEDTGRGEITNTHVLDFRPGRRRIPVTLACISAANQGACGTWDVQYQQSESAASCEWDADLGDLRCLTTETRTTTWGARQVTRAQALVSGMPIEPPSVDHALALVARQVHAGSPVPAVIATERLGPAHVLWRRPLADGGWLAVVGFPGTTAVLDATFRVLQVDRSGLATWQDAEDVPLGPPAWERAYDRQHSTSHLAGAPLDAGVIMRAQPALTGAAGPTILRVHVREGEAFQGRGSGQAVYWVGVDTVDERVGAGALRLATDTYEYLKCAAAATPPNAIAARIETGADFNALLDIEPPHSVELFSGTPDESEAAIRDLGLPACATTARVEWHRGFVVTHQSPGAECRPPARSRFVRIDDGGDVEVVNRPEVGERPPGSPPPQR